MKYTKNYNLSKPELDDFVDINILSNNFEIIDDALLSNEQNINQISNKNLLIDGGFQVWLDGDIQSTLQDYGATIWKNSFNASDFVIKKVDNGIFVSGTNLYGGLRQHLDNFYFASDILTLSSEITVNKSRSCTCMLSIRTEANTYEIISNKSISLKQGLNEVSLNFDTSSIKKQTLEIVLTLFSIESASKTDIEYTVHNVKLEYGSIATPFIKETYEKALESVAPYYEQSFDGEWLDNNEKVENQRLISICECDTVTFLRRKRVMPTITFLNPNSKELDTEAVSDWFLDRVDLNVDINYISQKGFATNLKYPPASCAGYFTRRYHWIADARIY